MKRDFGSWCVECAINVWRSPFGNNSRLRMRLWLVAISSVSGDLALSPVGAQETNAKDYSPPSTDILQLSEIEKPATTVDEWLNQIAQTSVVQVTGVRLDATEDGFEVVLETPTGSLTSPVTNVVDNTLIADIPNAVLVLPDRTEFQQANPIEGITLVSVSNLPNNQVRVAITGFDAPPIAEFSSVAQRLVVSVAPAETEDTIEIVVTGEQETGYYVPDTSTATRTDTPLRDIPASIQVVLRQILEDQQITRLNEAFRNVPGVEIGGVSPRTTGDFVNIRGFDTGFNNSSFLRNGIQDPRLGFGGFNLATIERIEFLRGPASVLYGNLEPGGAINLVTKQPLSEPFYAIEASIGSFDSYRGALDFSGPLNESGTVLYRFNAAAQISESFIDFLFDRRYVVAPTLAINFNNSTSLNVWGEYSKLENSFDLGVPAVGSVLPNPLGDIPRNRNLIDPDNFNVDETYRIGFDLQHRFSDNWQLRSAFLASFYTNDRDFAFTRALLDDNRTVTRGFSRGNPVFSDDLYNSDTYVTGEFLTGSIQHQLTAGINLRWNDSFVGSEDATAEPIDIFNPLYNPPTSSFVSDPGTEYGSRILGIYIQDQVTLLDNLKLLLGGRFNFAHQEQRNLL